MKTVVTTIILSMALLAVLNGIDYQGLLDAFADGKTRYLLLALVPISFLFFSKRLGWAPSFVGALALFSYVIHDYRPSHDTVLPIVSIFAVLGFSCALLELGERAVGSVLIASGVIQGCIALLQYLRAAHLLPFGFPHHAKPDGLIGEQTTLAAFLVVCLAPALWRKQWWAVALIAPAVVACQSVGGIVCMATVLAVWGVSVFPLLSTKPGIPFLAWACFMGIGANVVGLFYGRSILDSDGRFFMWSFGLRAVKEAPWFGSGIGAWDQIFLPRFKGEILETFHYHLPRSLHNDYLDFAVEYGLAPLADLLAFGVSWLNNFRPTWPHAVCAVLMVDSLFSFPATTIYLSVPFVVCWALSREGQWAKAAE